MKIEKKYVKRVIMGTHLAIPVGNSLEGSREMIKLEGIADFIWDQLVANDCTRDELLTSITTEYDVDAEIAGKDLDAFLKQLKDVSVI